MTATDDPTDRHLSAARHHEQAAHFHREAARHYQIGKDYAHAAHLAVTAHGHALRALEHGQAASEVYAGQEGSGSQLPGYLSRAVDKSPSSVLASPITLDDAGHHVVAAQHHDAAVQHHTKAEVALWRGTLHPGCT